MSGAPAIELTGISKRFAGGVIALDDVHLQAERGTIHALLGENGAGKTTLMRLTYGLLRADSGLIRLDGRDAHVPSPAAAIANGIGMVHQHPENVGVMTVAENVALGGRGTYRRSQARANARRLADRVGFDLDPDAPSASLAVADQQRLEILKAISRDVRVLILDEPTAVLSPTDATGLLRWLRGFAETGGTAIVITHRLDEALEHADAVTVLRNGRTVLESAAVATSRVDLTSAMLGAAPAALPSTAPRSTPGDAVVSAVGLGVRRPNNSTAIVNASFEVRRGEILGIVGLERSGHHELLLALAGRLQPSSGTLSLPPRMSFVPEDRHADAAVLDFSLTENVAIHGAGDREGWMNWSAVERQTSALMQQFDVRARDAHQPLAGLSGGNQQKLVLARELAAAPDLLVAENPTRGLDIRASAFVRSQLREARDHGTAVVAYSSDLDEVLSIADRVLVVHAGTVSEIAGDRAAVGAAMLGLA